MLTDGLKIMDDGLPGTSYASLMAFPAGAFVFQVSTPEKKNDASLITFLPVEGMT